MKAAQNRRMRWQTAGQKEGSLWVYSGLVLAIVILLFPIYWMFLIAVLPDDRLLTYPPTFLPTPSTLFVYPFKRIFDNRPVARWLLNALYVSGLTTIVSIMVSALGGYALSRIRTAESRVMGAMLLVIRMLPGTLLVTPLYILFTRVHLIDNLVTLVIANTSYILPFGVWMMKGFYDGIPKEIEESAQVDGCTLFQAFVRVIVVLSRPGLAATGMYCFVLAWGELLFARTLMNSSEKWTITPGVTTYVGDMMISWNDMMAASLLASIPVLLIFLHLEKHLVRGLVSGAIK